MLELNVNTQSLLVSSLHSFFFHFLQSHNEIHYHHNGIRGENKIFIIAQFY